MASLTEWVQSAENNDLVFPLSFDQGKDLVRLYASGLPVYDHIVLAGHDPDLEAKVDDFCAIHDRQWVRVRNQAQRYSTMGLAGTGDILTFLQSLDITLSQFSVQLFEWHRNLYGGNILSLNDAVKVEVAEGSQDLVGKGGADLFHGSINMLGRLEFATATPDFVAKVCRQALQYLRLSRGEYLQGYFEFVFCDNHGLYFLDYKKGLFNSFL